MPDGVPFAMVVMLLLALLLVVAWAGTKGLLWGDLPLERGRRASPGERVAARVVGAVIVVAFVGLVLLAGWFTGS